MISRILVYIFVVCIAFTLAVFEVLHLLPTTGIGGRGKIRNREKKRSGASSTTLYRKKAHPTGTNEKIKDIRSEGNPIQVKNTKSHHISSKEYNKSVDTKIKTTKFPKGYWKMKKEKKAAQKAAEEEYLQSHPVYLPVLSMNHTIQQDDLIESSMERKRSYLEQTVSDCFCPNGRPNYIYYANCPGEGVVNQGAGIKDRLNILRNILWYADELCAKVVLRCSPHVWLSEAHGCFAPRDANWESYFTPIRSVNGVVGKADVLIQESDANALHRRFKNMEKIQEIPSVALYESLSKRSKKKMKPFYWVFDQDFWHTNLYDTQNFHHWPQQRFIHRSYSNDCSMVDLDTSLELLNVGQLIMNSLGIKYSHEFVTLHLRQGDWNGCDTSPDAVVEYLECSLDGYDDVEKIVVMTNGDKTYFDSLENEFKVVFPKKQMIFLDEYVASHNFQELLNHHNLTRSHYGERFLYDNCYQFSAEKVLVTFANFHLERGHAHCKNCDKGGASEVNAII